MVLRFMNKTFDMDDVPAVLNIACCVLGLGSVAFARNFSNAGPIYATIALFIMCIVNIYATVILSKCLKRAPMYVQTFGDLGEHCAGKIGRYVVVVSQFGSCLMTPIAFLVLGGTIILPSIFREIYPTATSNMFIPLMALALLPVVLIRTIKEAAWAAFLGAAGTLFGDLIAVLDSWMNSNHYGNASTQPMTVNVVSVFGSMSLAYGAAVVIPAIQREHKRPENMPILIGIAMIGITLVYLLIGVAGYLQYGCVAPKNLLLSMTDRRFEVAAHCMFFLHTLLAYAVLVNPALYIFERQIFGFYRVDRQSNINDSEASSSIDIIASPNNQDEQNATIQYIKPEANAMNRESFLHGKHSLKSPFSGELGLVASSPGELCFRDRIKSYILRTTVVAMQVFVAILLQGSFDEFADLIGSSSISFSCIIVPILMYLKMFPEINRFEKWICYCIMIVCAILGAYTSYTYAATIIDNIVTFKPFHAVKATFGPGKSYATCASTPYEL